MLFQIIIWVLQALGISQSDIENIYLFSILKNIDSQVYFEYIDSINCFEPRLTIYMIFPIVLSMLINYVQLSILKMINNYFNNKYIISLINFIIITRKSMLLFLVGLLLIVIILDILLFFKLI